MSTVYVGTASWTDPTLINTTDFYPSTDMSAEERLKFYAKHFNAVEVDSTFYALPAERVVALQAERTPASFNLNYKAFGMLTQHNVDPKRLPKAVKMLIDPRQLEQPSLPFRHVTKDVLDLSFQMFSSALRPAYNAGKLGPVLFQFSPGFHFSDSNMEYIADVKNRLFDYRVAIEFRNPSWVSGEHIDETMSFLRTNELAYVSVDEPQFDSHATVPPIMTATTDIGYVRMHGRNKETWFKRNLSAAERFSYLYSDSELSDLEKKIDNGVIQETAKTYVLFNNCFKDYGVRNAMTMKTLIEEKTPALVP